MALELNGFTSSWFFSEIENKNFENLRNTKTLKLKEELCKLNSEKLQQVLQNTSWLTEFKIGKKIFKALPDNIAWDVLTNFFSAIEKQFPEQNLNKMVENNSKLIKRLTGFFTEEFQFLQALQVCMAEKASIKTFLEVILDRFNENTLISTHLILSIIGCVLFRADKKYIEELFGVFTPSVLKKCFPQDQKINLTLSFAAMDFETLNFVLTKLKAALGDSLENWLSLTVSPNTPIMQDIQVVCMNLKKAV